MNSSQEVLTPNPLNKKLAELLGWTGVHLIKVPTFNYPMMGNFQKMVYVGDTASGHSAQIPDWCGSWVEAGPLIKKYDIDIMHSWSHTYFRIDKDIDNRVNTENLEGGDSDNVIRQGIVSAVISKLGSAKP